MVTTSTSPDDMIMVGDREVFMSFGLLHELLAIVKDIPSVTLIAVEPQLRNDVVTAVLAERDENGKITTPFNFMSIKASIAEVQNMIAWVSEHLLDFFLGAIERNVRTHEKHQPRLVSSMASGTGSSA